MRADPRPRWWVEIGLTIAFYLIYSAVRNQFGSALGREARNDAFANALDVIGLEKAVGLYHEEWIQSLFIDWTLFIRFWNIFYGTFHFLVTIGAMVYLFLYHSRRYLVMRSVLASTTALALIGFAAYPLMPPRLLSNCASQYGAPRPDCAGSYEFVDTLVDPGGWWSFDSGTMQSISNQYAAMPSLHIAWALWCTVALYPVLRRGWPRVLIALYPVATLFSIIVTANHYWFDAVGGIVVLGAGFLIGRPLSRILPGLPSPAPPTPEPSSEAVHR
ncbi:MAG: phosphatase PAP2 family protein [Acidimicrobiales bacterium]